MKKLSLIVAVVTTFAASSANAYNSNSRWSIQDGPYVGLDLNFSNISHTNPNANDDDNIGLGVNLGYKIWSGKAFIAPELFYDYLDTTVVYRLGGKVNLGYNFAPKLNGFVNFGLANSGYDDTSPASQSSYSSSATKMSTIYGFGLSYDLNNDWALKAAYDWQRFNIRYVNTGTDRVSLNVFRLGAIYNF